MSRRDTKTARTVMNETDCLSEQILDISSDLVSKYCGHLDNLVADIREVVASNQLTDEQLEYYILTLANTLYFVGSAQEDLGIKEDTCKAIRQELYNKAREQAKGTVADKDMVATLATQQETIALSIYTRAYRKVKMRMDAGYELLNSLKKVMNRRISDLELSNSRYIGGINNAG